MQLRDHLRGEVLRAAWDDLAPHFARGALLVAAADVDLLDAAVAIATDDSASVAGWLGEGRLGKPSEEQAAAWAESAPTFQVLILQPFVLAQPLSP